MSQGQDGTFSRSVQWQTLNVGVQILIQLAFVRVLGEFLTESEWGLVGVVLGFAGLLEIFAQLGVGPSLIQRKDPSQILCLSLHLWVRLLLLILKGSICWNRMVRGLKLLVCPISDNVLGTFCNRSERVLKKIGGRSITINGCGIE